MGDGVHGAKPVFEPPPWEREAFEALAAKRAEQHPAVESAVELAVEPDTDDVVREEDLVAMDEAPLDEKQLETMLSQLRSEERSDGRSATVVGWTAAGVMLVLGVSMLGAGLSTARVSGGKRAVVIGSAVLSVFGLCFVGMAAWVWIVTNRMKGRS